MRTRGSRGRSGSCAFPDPRDRVGQCGERGAVIADAEVDAQHATSVLLEHLVVAGRLRTVERLEPVALARDRVLVLLGADLEEHPGRRAALVELPGRMQE